MNRKRKRKRKRGMGMNTDWMIWLFVLWPLVAFCLIISLGMVALKLLGE